MVDIANTAAKLISTTTNARTGTTVKKFVTQNTRGEKILATVAEYGQNNPLKQKGVDTFIKLDGKGWKEAVDKILMSGDEVILSGASKAENFETAGNFNARFKEMMDLLKKYPKLTADLISDTTSRLGRSYGHQTIFEKLLGQG